MITIVELILGILGLCGAISLKGLSIGIVICTLLHTFLSLLNAKINKEED